MAEKRLTSLTLPVKGLHCNSCAILVGETLQEQPGVAAANVDLTTNTVTVSFDPEATSPRVLAKALAPEGYTLVTD